MADILLLGLDVGGDDMVLEEEVHISKLKEKAVKRKGRGFSSHETTREVIKTFETLDIPGSDVLDCDAQRSVDGWILMVRGIHEEAHEDDVQQLFSDYGTVKSLHLNLDRRTGFLKGYALVQFENFVDAQAAKTTLDGSQFLGNTIFVDWTFKKQPSKVHRTRRH